MMITPKWLYIYIGDDFDLHGTNDEDLAKKLSDDGLVYSVIPGCSHASGEPVEEVPSYWYKEDEDGEDE